jgi:hypothetical protein
MSNFNFVVRATDSSGSFADRQFSLTVNNTNVANIVIACNTIGSAYSVDGKNWNAIPGVTGKNVAYGNGWWIMGLGTTTIRRSQNGINWTSVEPTADRTYYDFFTDFAYGNGVWLASGWKGSLTASSIYKSNDNGLSWTKVYNSFPAGMKIKSMVYGAAGWSLSSNTGLYYSVDNGTTWTKSIGLSNTASGAQAIYANGLYVVNVGYGSPLYYSSDLTNWVTKSNHLGYDTMCGICYGNGRLFTSTYADGTNGTFHPIVSNNKLASWTSGSTLGVVNAYVDNTDIALTRTQAFYNGYFIYSGAGYKIIRYSVDGISFLDATINNSSSIGTTNSMASRA